MRRWIVDTIVAAVVALAQVASAYGTAAHHPGQRAEPAAIALLAVGGVVLIGRRRFPVVTLAATYVTIFVFIAIGQPGSPGWLGCTVAFCTAIYLGRRVSAVLFLVACYVTALWGPLLAGQPGPKVIFAESLGAGLAFLLGAAELIRLWRQRAAAVEQRRREEARRRASEERLRIARDLHDVVAHSISVINVQAATALHLMDRQPDRARTALVTINQVSKQALVEVRSVLGVLRSDEDERAPREPSASLARLGDLVRGAADAGLTVDVESDASLSLPTDVSLAAYRIVQEALTNSARHSGGGRAVVRLARGERDLVIEVDDDGPGSSAGEPGNGIIGMTERAHALGGTLEAGPRPDGGFRVRARLPLSSEETP